ncbi:hypothetical protein QBC41DRAFT_318269 [Cercophora samala]|uniref:Uncharacterized protein n=1 Tax=Cercophora samala TaxID=330535 RepID=A0AA39ZFY7_9PEZI|nr:hypothetical protein QBC41DRAFT_318269 [Cercophora samala]
MTVIIFIQDSSLSHLSSSCLSILAIMISMASAFVPTSPTTAWKYSITFASLSSIGPIMSLSISSWQAKRSTLTALRL